MERLEEQSYCCVHTFLFFNHLNGLNIFTLKSVASVYRESPVSLFPKFNRLTNKMFFTK